MPVGWQPKSSKIESLIQEEENKIEALKPVWNPAPAPQITQDREEPANLVFSSLNTEPTITPTQPIGLPEIQPRPRSQAQVSQLKEEEPEQKQIAEIQKQMTMPFWQRALQVFGAPFNWMDENIVKPGLGLISDPLIPNVERKKGEQYWEWKKRSWEEWRDPGVEFDTPWGKKRIGLKGVAEFAPWLLIPGANSVGGAIKGLGTAGKVVGTAIQYSPWGLTEKATGVALKGMIKGVSSVEGRVSKKVFGQIVEPEPPPTVKKLTSFFKGEVIPAREQFGKALPELRQKQASIVLDIRNQLKQGKITAIQATKQIADAEKTLGGIKQNYSLKPQFDQDEVEELLGMAYHSTEKGLSTQDAAVELQNLLLNGVLPEPHNIRFYSRIYGKEFAEAVGSFSKMSLSKREQLVDFLNLPRAVMASGDLSATARQGLILGLAHPTQVPRAFKNQLKAFFSERLALQADDAMRSDPLFLEYIERGGYHAPLEKNLAVVTKWEESFSSKVAERIPWVRRSERAFNVYLNDLRFGTYKAVRNSWTAQGAGTKELEVLTDFINIASGRGTLPANLERYAPLLNTVLFSPRLQASRLQLPKVLGQMLLSENPYMRKESAKALVTFLGGGASLLALLQAGGAGTVQLDPRSADFGKMKIGDTRIDIWTGYVQYLRFAAQMLTGERKTAYGNLNKAERLEIAGRFLQSKSSPLAGLMVDILRGETYQGEKLFGDTSSALNLLKERTVPLYVQDMIDAMEQSGINGLLYSSPAFLGVGALTYVDDLVKTRDKVARQVGAKSWEALDPKTQRELEQLSPDLQRAILNTDRQIMDTAWGDWRIAGNTIEENFKGKVNLMVTKYRQTLDGVQFRKDIDEAYTERRGAYRAREEDPNFREIIARQSLPDTKEALAKLGPEQLAIRTYNDALYGDDMYDEFGDYRFDEADSRRQQLIQSMGQQMVDYIETYQGMRYDDLPSEFQELTRAKKVMKPYWGIQDDVERLFGKSFAESNRGQSLISKRRKQLRLRDAEVGRAYDLFYSQNS